MRPALSILTPLGWLYGLAVSLRREAYGRGLFPRQRLRSPVISVGGLARGGSMKTPVVIELARALSARGALVGVLGHGYRGEGGRPRVVSDGENLLETARAVGDEAVLLAHELPGCPVVVGKDKVAAGRLLEQRFGRLIVLVDSGFQHLRLFRDLDIVCVSERDLTDRVLPSGMLRESARALKSADLIFTDRESDAEKVARLRAQRPADLFSAARADFGFFSHPSPGLELKAPEKAFILSAIGKPERFASDVAAQGVEVVGQHVFRDHHRFSARDLGQVATAAEKAGASAVVTTAKDAVRIPAWPGAVPLVVLAARLDIEGLPAVLKRIDKVTLARPGIGA